MNTTEQENSNLSSHDLQSVLQACSEVATRWYWIASKQAEETRALLYKAKEDTEHQIQNIEQSAINAPHTVEILRAQAGEINKIIRIEGKAEQDLENHRVNMSKFSITLFGRTMAGKSTLMEILTHGNGKSIGQGAQRTTRDVRHYTWNHLDITDVPGIAAVDGKEDAETAFPEAQKADMILFLLTDDGPQKSEAEWFSKLIALGKPILCVINVKASMPEGKSDKFIEKQIQKRFDMDRLETIRDQFRDFAKNYGQSWAQIPFVYVHLKSAFYAVQHHEAPEIAEKYERISRIRTLTDQIVEIVKSKGKFYRIKNFADTICNPMIESLNTLFGTAKQCCKLSVELDRTIHDISNWKNHEYMPQCKQTITSICKSVQMELLDEITEFADENYENPNADKVWQKLCERAWKRHQNEVIDMASSAHDKLQQFASNLTHTAFLSSGMYANSVHFSKCDGISGTKEGLRTAFSTLTTSAGIAALINPIFGIALAIGAGITGITSLFFKSKERKIQERKSQIEKKLYESIDDMHNNLLNALNRYVFNNIVPNLIDKTIQEMRQIQSGHSEFYHHLLTLGSQINGMLCRLNKRVVCEAIVHSGAAGLEFHVLDAARIPGHDVLILLQEGTVFPEENTHNLSQLMSEEIRFDDKTTKRKDLIAGILNIDKDRITIKDDSARVIPSDQEIETTRIYLAQQLADIPIWVLRHTEHSQGI